MALYVPTSEVHARHLASGLTRYPHATVAARDRERVVKEVNATRERADQVYRRLLGDVEQARSLGFAGTSTLLAQAQEHAEALVGMLETAVA